VVVSAPLTGRKLHLVGIGGAGMSGLALAAVELGAEVSGSDREESSYSQRLRDAGVTVFIGHAAEQVPSGADVIRSTAIPDDNPEIATAHENGLRILHRSELLAELAALSRNCITIAGTHGKTTTTAMVAHMLDALGADPSFFVGGEVTVGGRTTNAHVGAGEVVVLEADESDGSFERYSPDVAVITNIEFEHPETWTSFDDLLAAFARHVAPADKVVVDIDEPNAAELNIEGRAVTFSATNPAADFAASDIADSPDPTGGTSFVLGAVPVTLAVRGRHNVKNALAALAAVTQLGHSVEAAAPALASFRGVARRFQPVGESVAGAKVYDDYAHHPTEVRAALETARGVAGEGRVVVFFQPHLYSRTKLYSEEFAEALLLADEIVVLDVYPARELAADFPGVSGELIVSAATTKSTGQRVHSAPTLDDAETLAAEILGEGDIAITMGAGTITQLSRRLTEGSSR
jgi:UDP-N-acetylmuramate--alanine ligase